MPEEAQAISTVTLYNIAALKEENNFIIENMANFLSAQTVKSSDISCQYQRLENGKRLKLNLSQSMADYQRTYNYAKISNGYAQGPAYWHYSEFYYFITDYRQIAPNTVELELKLDVLNTFFKDFKNQFTKQSLIARAHRDRFTIANKDNANARLDLCDKYDRVPENDTPNLVRSTSESMVIYDERGGDSEQDPLKFYMIYRTSEGADARPVIDIAANRLLKMEEGASGEDYVLNTSDLVDGRYYYVLGDIAFTVGGRLYIAGGTYSPFNFTFQGEGILVFNKSVYQSITTIEVMFISNSGMATAPDGSFGMPGDYWGLFTGPLTITKGKYLYYSNNLIIDENAIREMDSILINAGEISPKYLGAISELDRTKSNILKVIECPYCPISYGYALGLYAFDRIRFPNDSEENPPFLRSFNVGENLEEQPIKTLFMDSIIMQRATFSDLTSKLSPYLEDPKLKTSPYFSITMVYDSFSMDIKLEDFERSTPLTDGSFNITINYKQSANISSDLAYSIEEGGNLGYHLYKSEENYPHILAASRNNELPLFSSEYLNYIRNGYNYDKKKMGRDTAFSGAMAGLQLVASILSFAASGVTAGVSGAAGIGLAASGISSAASTAFTAAKANEDLTQKINLLKSQSFKVSSIDNLDLFNWYAGNKLLYNVYKLEDHEKREIAERFQLYGYAVGEYGDPADFLYTRKYFNYLRCDPVFKDGSFVIGSFLEEISERLRSGVTLFHPPGYDLNRNVENIEVSIIEAIED